MPFDTVTDFGGYQAVLAVHAEGSIEAEKMTIWPEHDIEPRIQYAKWLAGITDGEYRWPIPERSVA